MQQSDKITAKQAFLLFFTLGFSPSVRLFPAVAAKNAKQAGWLTPIISFLLLFLLINIIQSLYKNNECKSLQEIMLNVTGKIIGRFLIVINIVYCMILNAAYVRFYAERLTSSIYHSINIEVFIVIMLIICAFVLYSGIVVITRMNQILLPFIGIMFMSITLLILGKLEVKNILPISYLDIIPIAKGSIGITAICSYATIVFYFGDKIKGTDKIKKSGINVAIISFIFLVLMILATIGALGHNVVAKFPYPFFAATRLISLFETVERIESILVALWIMADFIIIIIFAYVTLKLIKTLFNLSSIKPLIPLYFYFQYIMCQFIAINRIELDSFSEKILQPLNCIIFIGIPLIVYIIGKIRRVV